MILGDRRAEPSSSPLKLKRRSIAPNESRGSFDDVGIVVKVLLEGGGQDVMGV